MSTEERRKGVSAQGTEWKTPKLPSDDPAVAFGSADVMSATHAGEDARAPRIRFVSRTCLNGTFCGKMKDFE